MRRIFYSIIFLSFGLISFAQTTKTSSTKKPTAAKPVAPKVLKDIRDSASYTAGIHIVNRYRSQNIYNFNSQQVSKAVNDMQGNKPLSVANADADRVVLAYQSYLMNDPKPADSARGKALCDSASYAAGVYLVSFFRDFDIVNFNSAIVSKAIDDLQAKRKPLMGDSLANAVAMRYQFKIQEVKNKPTIDAGKKFLAENKKRPTVKVTKSGLRYEIIKQGNGPKPTKNDKISCNYTGAYIDGTEFNNSYKMGGPISFNVTQVIKGWTEALLMMPVGSKWKLYVPYLLGYGPGQYQAIPGGSTLVFEIELLGIVDK